MPDSAPTPSPAVSESDLTGRELGDYRILRRLGRGGMAEVYLAEQASLRRQVAVKVLKSGLASDPAYVQRFHQEAQAAASLVHANIVQIHEVGCREGFHFIAQEYVAGHNLRQLLTRQGPLPVELAVTVLRQVAAALHKAGQQGIVHRDIKPENILLGPGGEVKVADFGLARVMTSGETLNLTQAGITMGTPLYMSPEQVEGRALDPRSDIYSLGVTIYHILAGRPPFEGETPLAVAVQHLQNRPTPIEELRPDVPPVLAEMVQRMLTKKPADRYQSAAELLAALRPFPAAGDETDWLASAAALTAEMGGAFVNTSDGVNQATLALQRTMALAPRISFWQRYLLPLAAAGVAVAFAAGAAVAYLQSPKPLLSSSTSHTDIEVPRKESAEAQYVYASLVNNEPAWKGVEAYFPSAESERNRYYARRATQQLGRYYLQNDRLDEALAMFDRLAALGPGEAQFQAYGLFGQAWIYSLQGNHQRAAELVAEVVPLQQHLDADAREELDLIQRRTREALK